MANFGDSFGDTRPWNALNYMIKVAEVAGNSLQMIASFQRHTWQDQERERKGYFICDLCKEMPKDERPVADHLGVPARIAEAGHACRAADDTAQGTSQSTTPSATLRPRGPPR